MGNDNFKKKQLINDPRIIKAKELISEAIKEYQNLFTQKILLLLMNPVYMNLDCISC